MARRQPLELVIKVRVLAPQSPAIPEPPADYEVARDVAAG
jgi:hypothetical protein